MSRKVVIYGCGAYGVCVLNEARNNGEFVAAFCDSNAEKWGTTVQGVKVMRPSEELFADCDAVLVGSYYFMDSIIADLGGKYGVNPDRIDIKYAQRREMSVESRRRFLYDFAELAQNRGINGAVAECGVYKGEFAKHINRAFRNNRLYLFDTFTGFDDRDKTEKNREVLLISHNFNTKGKELAETCLPHPEKAIFCVGYVPETLAMVPAEERFVFVNLDMDLEKPTLSALRFFYGKLLQMGVILVHDYFKTVFSDDIRCACDQFSAEAKVPYFPIGDGMSVAFYKM